MFELATGGWRLGRGKGERGGKRGSGDRRLQIVKELQYFQIVDRLEVVEGKRGLACVRMNGTTRLSRD